MPQRLSAAVFWAGSSLSYDRVFATECLYKWSDSLPGYTLRRDVRDKLATVKTRLSELCTQFSKNLNEYVSESEQIISRFVDIACWAGGCRAYDCVLNAKNLCKIPNCLPRYTRAETSRRRPSRARSSQGCRTTTSRALRRFVRWSFFRLRLYVRASARVEWAAAGMIVGQTGAAFGLLRRGFPQATVTSGAAAACASPLSLCAAGFLTNGISLTTLSFRAPADRGRQVLRNAQVPRLVYSACKA